MNYYKEILKDIETEDRLAQIRGSDRDSGDLYMLKHLIELLGEEEFNIIFDSYFLYEEKFDEAFYDLHKSMRQTDFFGNNFVKRIPMKTVDGKNSCIYKNIGGHLDMLFWNLIQASEIPYKILKNLKTLHDENLDKTH